MEKKKDYSKLTLKELNLSGVLNEELTIGELENEGIYVETSRNVALFKVVGGAKSYKSLISPPGFAIEATEIFDIGFTARTDANGVSEVFMKQLIPYQRDLSRYYHLPYNVTATPRTNGAFLSAIVRPVPNDAEDLKFTINSFSADGQPAGNITFDVRAMMAYTDGPD